MKTKLFFLAAFLLSLSLGVRAQVIKSTHAFAVGSPEGVTIQWDAFGDDEITGCYVYKRLTEYSPLQLITTEILVSDDAFFSYVDEGEFDSIRPPLYEIHAVSNSENIKINDCFGFKSIDFEVLEANRIQFGLTPWNQDVCCENVQVFLNEIFEVDTDYGETFQTTIDLNLLSAGDVLRYTLMYYTGGPYESARVTLSYLNHLTQTLGLGNQKTTPILSQNIPNPFATETTIRFDLKEKSLVLLDIYSIDGRWVESLINKTLMPGIQSFTFSKGNLKPGIYLYRLTTGNEVSVRRMVVN